MTTIQRLLRKSESASWVDRPAGAAAGTVRRMLDGSRADGVLRGSWLGHPVHPLLIAVPIGAWIASAVLDLAFTDERDAARRLVALGLVITAPTVVTGVADFSGLDTRQRRVGAIHAAANAVATACYLASYRCRSRGKDRAGRVWSTLGLGAISVGGALGGHLSYAQGAGVHRWNGKVAA